MRAARPLRVPRSRRTPAGTCVYQHVIMSYMCALVRVP
jgi:hypothetical protein